MLSEEDNTLETEIEALKSIYIHELQIDLNEQNKPDSITVQLHPATADNVTEQFVKLSLILKLHSEYPYCEPEILIQNTRGLSDEEIESIYHSICMLATEKKGNPMLFELIEVAKENLTKVNKPSCQCAICLYGFAENDILTKTECFHYFHSHCLTQYVLHNQKTLEEMKESPSYKPIVCPVCRLPISFSISSENHPPPVESEIDEIKISKEVRILQKKMQRLYNIQKKKGGIIDIEAEKNKYLLEISNMPNVSNIEFSSAPEKQDHIDEHIDIEGGCLKDDDIEVTEKNKFLNSSKDISQSKFNHQKQYKRYRSNNLGWSTLKLEKQKEMKFPISRNKNDSDKGTLTNLFENKNKKFLPRNEDYDFNKGIKNESKYPLTTNNENKLNKDTINKSFELKNELEASLLKNNEDCVKRTPKYSLESESFLKSNNETNGEYTQIELDEKQTLYCGKDVLQSSEIRERDFKDIFIENNKKSQRYHDKKLGNKQKYDSKSYYKGNYNRMYSDKGNKCHQHEYVHTVQKSRADYSCFKNRKILPYESDNISNYKDESKDTLKQNNNGSCNEAFDKSIVENMNAKTNTDYSVIDDKQKNKGAYFRTFQNNSYRNKKNENIYKNSNNFHYSHKNFNKPKTFKDRKYVNKTPSTEHNSNCSGLPNHNLDVHVYS